MELLARVTLVFAGTVAYLGLAVAGLGALERSSRIRL
jgi:hypothetical protein